jgi:transposase InsO family protein
MLHSDRGGEYLFRAVRTVLDQKGIEHKLTMPGSLQQNSLAEQWNCTLLDKACALLHGTSLSLGFWEYAVDTTVHTYNRTPTCTIGWCMPHELWNAGHIPDVSYFHVFRCKAFVYVLKDK